MAHELRVTHNRIERGTRVRVKPSVLAAHDLDTHDSGLGVVKSVTEGGTVTLKCALHGFRCWDVNDLEAV